MVLPHHIPTTPIQTDNRKFRDKNQGESVKTPGLKLVITHHGVSGLRPSKKVFLSKYGILFDLDGTLVDSLADICGNVNKVRASFGLAPIATEIMVKFIGKGVEQLIHLSFPELNDAQRSGLIAKYREHYAETPTMGGKTYPGVRETLETLKQRGIKLAIATNKATDIAHKTLAHYLPGIEFDLVAGPEKVSKRKPAPEHLTEVISQLGLEVENVCFIGDDPVDKQSAEAAGVMFLGAAYGFGGVPVQGSERLDQFSDLLGRIAFLNEAP